MRNITKHATLIKYLFYSMIFLLGLGIFLISPGISKYSKDGAGTTLVSVYVNGTNVGNVDDVSIIDESVIEARKRLAKSKTGLVLAYCNVVTRGSNTIFAITKSKEELSDAIYEVLAENTVLAKPNDGKGIVNSENKVSAYEVKINTFTVNVKTADDVNELLKRAKDLYDTGNLYNVKLVLDPTRELSVLTTQFDENAALREEKNNENPLPTAGMTQKFEQFYNEANNIDNSDLFRLGLNSLKFAEKVEVIQVYVDESEIVSLDEAVNLVTKAAEKEQTYIVKEGDTLGQIAQSNGLSIDKLVEINDLSGVNATIRIGDVLKVHAELPELSVLTVEGEVNEKSYNEEPLIIKNDEWYTTESVVRQKGETGIHKVWEYVTYKNGVEIGTEQYREEIIKKAVQQIVERGTKTPPTYIRPLSGGRLSSNFGRRKAPKKGASTYHKGLDFAVPVGSAIYASSGGTVTRAGWGKGYGYCVYIRHPDGKETRYGHCSKVLCKAGQTVRQGEKIALSGNTGVSTGPHLHFEILVGGAQVNPLNYIN